jgi:hypothetical protein
MPKFIINARETVFYRVEVEAESEKELRYQISLGNIDFNSSDIIDGDDFTIDAIYDNDELIDS